MDEMILILDFGSQNTQLLARKLRALSVYCEILPYDTVESIPQNVKGVIFSGSSFSTEETPTSVPCFEMIGEKELPCWKSVIVLNLSLRRFLQKRRNSC